jgi:hypothetical protein
MRDRKERAIRQISGAQLAPIEKIVAGLILTFCFAKRI